MRSRSIIVSALAFALALAVAPGVPASVSVATDAQAPTLHVNAEGVALVSWTTVAGSRQSIVIPPHGYSLPSNRFQGRDVSARVDSSRLAMAQVVRRTPDGALWALQAWRKHARGPVELHFSRWRGTPTGISLRALCCRYGLPTLTGEALSEGRPIYGSSPSPAGKGLPDKQIRTFVFLECFACAASAGGWAFMRAVAPRAPSGTYSLLLRPSWRGTRYRATIAGPNRGWTYAPDARSVLVSPR